MSNGENSYIKYKGKEEAKMWFQNEKWTNWSLDTKFASLKFELSQSVAKRMCDAPRADARATSMQDF